MGHVDNNAVIWSFFGHPTLQPRWRQTGLDEGIPCQPSDPNDGVTLVVVDAPVYFCKWYAQPVALFGKRDAAIRVRALFGDGLERYACQFVRQAATLKFFGDEIWAVLDRSVHDQSFQDMGRRITGK